MKSKFAQILMVTSSLVLGTTGSAGAAVYAQESTQIMNYITLGKQVAEAVRQTMYWKQMLEGLTMNNAGDVLRAMQLTQQGLGQVQGVWYTAARLEEMLGQVHDADLPPDMNPTEVQDRYRQLHQATAGTIREAYQIGVQARDAMAVTEQVIAMGGNASASSTGVRSAIQSGNQILQGIGGVLQTTAAMDVAAYRMQTEKAQREQTEQRLALQQRNAANSGFYGAAQQQPFGLFGFGQETARPNGQIVWNNTASGR